MIILGISAYHGDCSASIIKDGKLIAAVEEERFTRIKHWAGFPAKSIEFCLKEAKVNIKDLDYIAIARDPKANFKQKIQYVLKTPSTWKKLANRLKSKNTFESIDQTFSEKFNISADIIKPKIKYVEHHLAHLASAHLVSPFEESALISIDGFGDFVSSMYGVGTKNSINAFKRIYHPHSIGLFYTMITQYLGFKNYGDEYKVMGLSSFGKPKYLKEMNDIISVDDKGGFKLNMKYFIHNKIKVDFNWESGDPSIPDLYSDEFEDRFGKTRDKMDPVTDFHKDFAASMQKHTENIIFSMLNFLHKEVKIDNLSFAGGVAMNSVANGKILQNTPFKEIYLPPVPGDAGTSMGAAFYYYNHIMGNDRSFILNTGSWGPGYSNAEIAEMLESYKNKLPEKNFSVQMIEDEDKLVKITVDEIIKGNVIGWFQGKMEFGARALGNRSIVVDPRREDMQEILNARIKKREKFRPFAPSILAEEVGNWFEDDYPVPFMEKVYKIKEHKKSEIPAVTHVDGTGRLQSVEKEQNALYYKLINTFFKMTGVPIVLNTSFNENEPIVCNPKEAIEAFLRTKMDVVVLGNYFIKRINSN